MPVENYMESDDDLRMRLFEIIPEGENYTAEDLLRAKGAELDAIARHYEIEREVRGSTGS